MSNVSLMRFAEKTIRRSALFCALATALSACGGAAPDANVASGTAVLASAPVLTEQQLVDEVSAALQACSYDGSPLRVDARNMALGVNAGAGDVVDEIMRYTGLPQNFDVVEHPEVPNAAAVIVIGKDHLPHRVIAYNRGFMDEVRRATADNNWAPISIMAHEIGHHLSGHTIQPGGSQPPTELEADKFSGYVLYKMGAVLADAQKAMNTLVPETDGKTHPGRGKRVSAIAEGWQQACTQQSDNCSGDVAAAVAVQPAAPAAPAATPSTPVATPAPTSLPTFARADTLPRVDAIPAKFGKFVIDELGVLDPATRAAFEQRMYAHAAEHGVEIVTVLARDLDGLSADAYAQALMRSLRIGKLDVGNGAVLVAAPNSNDVGVAFGAGVNLELRDYIDLEKRRLKSFLDIGLKYCKGTCNADQSALLFAAAEHIADDTDSWDWQVRFQDLPELMAKFEENAKARDSGTRIEPKDDPTWRKIVRLEGKLVHRDASQGPRATVVNAVSARTIGAPLHVVSSDGRDLLIYADPQTETLMTSKLAEDRSYVFIARVASLSRNPKDALSFDLLSFDATP